MKRVTAFLRRYAHELIVCLIVLLGVWFRVVNLFDWMWFLSIDQARDMLVGRHIAEFGELLWRGPFTAATNGQVANSPLYYYVLAALWTIGRGPFGLVLFWAGISSVTILIAYRIGARVWDRTAGYILAFLFAVSDPLVIASRQIWQPNLLPVFVTLFLWLMAGPHGSRRMFRLCIAAVVLLLPLHIHYSSAVIVPAGIAWILWQAIGVYRRTRNITDVLWPLSVVAYMVMLLAVFTFRAAPLDQAGYFGSQLYRGLAGFGGNAVAAASRLVYFLWRSQDIPLYGAATAVFLALGVYGAFLWKKSPLREAVAWSGLVAVTAVLSVSLYGGDTEYYLIAAVPFVLFLFGIGLRTVLNLDRTVGVTVCLVVSLYLAASTSLLIREWSADADVYRESVAAARAITEDYALMSVAEGHEPEEGAVPALTLAFLTTRPYLPFDGWGTAGVWFLLERYYAKKLVRLVEYGASFVPVAEHPRYFYVICDHAERTGMYRICLDNFRGARNYVSESYSLLYRSRRYSVWRFRFVGGAPPGNIYNVDFTRVSASRKPR